MLNKTYEEYKNKKTLMYLDSIRNGWRKFPPSLQISLTDYCGQKCYMCDHWLRDNRVHMDYNLLMNFLLKAKDYFLETVCYSGGEPLMYKRVNDVMKWHIVNEIDFGFITSGSIPIKKIDIDCLFKSRFVRVSLDALDKDIYKKIRGVDAVDYVKRVIEHMLEYNINVEFGITVSKENINQISKLADYAMHLGIKRFRVWAVRHSKDGINNILEDEKRLAIENINIAIDNFSDVDHNLLDTIDILENGESKNNFHTCKASLYQLFIDPSGGIFPCCILAGDSEREHMGLSLMSMSDFIERDIDVFYSAVKEWSDAQVDNFCIENCTLRLSSINSEVEENWHLRAFH